MRRRIRAIFIGSIGNLVEWYDLYRLCGLRAVFRRRILRQLRPSRSTTALLFAAGFLVRPLGGFRAIGVGLPYALTVSIFGGTTDSLALGFKSLGHETWFYYYLTGMIGISLVVYLFMRDTQADSARRPQLKCFWQRWPDVPNALRARPNSNP
jgi:hypothetical protein